ncbi:Predicted metal-dependent hydrolase, TIM-barrel fold [Rhizobiales bacterium GAS191]|jgi:2-pyrone-4,6-dicarboxylate lactonase|nr:Predicted metal-dependent hydrolase, TIM-barrel fold [Rhizobiales bacterium GAS113]SEB87262.1 Predicted metal-dependent hydrolase, TIM-barrel fold [Rhizobiales bacterium GAS191]
MLAVESVPAPAVSPPKQSLPHGACDAHSHVFGSFDRFAPSQASVYALPEASPEAHEAMRAKLGISFGVLTQPAPYGSDPAAMLHALRAAKGRLRGIAATGPDIDDETLADWHAASIRGLRFVEMRAPGGGRYPGSVGVDALRELAPRLRELGWHAQLWANAADHAALLPGLLRLGLPLVLDHMGCPDPARGRSDSAFAAILDLMRSGQIWVKIAICRVSRAAPFYEDARPLHEALLEAAPERLLWGSDWPYVRLQPIPDAGRLLDLFHDWTPDETLRRRILVDNPSKLYGFGAASGEAA